MKNKLLTLFVKILLFCFIFNVSHAQDSNSNLEENLSQWENTLSKIEDKNSNSTEGSLQNQKDDLRKIIDSASKKIAIDKELLESKNALLLSLGDANSSAQESVKTNNKEENYKQK